MRHVPELAGKTAQRRLLPPFSQIAEAAGIYSRIYSLAQFVRVTVTNDASDETAETAAGGAEPLHLPDVCRSRALVRIEIDGAVLKLDRDRVVADLVGDDAGVAAEIAVALHAPLPVEHRLHLRDLALLAFDDASAQLADFLVLQRRLAAHQHRAGVMRDHRAQELPVADRRLLSDQGEEHDRGDAADREQREVDALVWIHRSHQQDFDDDHRRRHQRRHVDLVEVVKDIGEAVDHRVHQRVHRQEGQCRHDGEADVGVVVHGAPNLRRLASHRPGIVHACQRRKAVRG